MARRMLLLGVIGISVLSWANAAQVSYFDGGSFINAAQSNQLSSADAVTVVLGSLLNAETSAHSTAGVSEQVERVLSASVFQRPSVVLAVQVLGAGDALSKLDDSKAVHSATVDADASTLLRAVTAVVGSSEQRFVYKSLAPANLPATCGDRCKEKTAHNAVIARGFNYTAQEQPSWDCDAGPWCYLVTSGDEKLLNMGFAEDRLFVLELGALRHQALAAAHTQKAGSGVAGPPKLLEATLLGLQAVRSKYGAESRQASAAAAMLQGTLAEVWAALHDATGGRVVAQLASVDVRPDAKLPDMQQWLDQHQLPFRRRLLQQDGKYNTAQIGDVAVTWATSSVAWLVSIIILIFIIASAVCLCNMKFEQDTLLYARPKAD